MKFNSLLIRYFFVLELFFVQTLFSQNKLLFSGDTDKIEYGKAFSITCSLSNSNPLGIKIKTWDWCIIDWNYNRIDTIVTLHRDQKSDTCTLNGSFNYSDLHSSSMMKMSHNTYAIVRAVDTNNTVIYAAKNILLWQDPIHDCGCLEDDIYTETPPNILFAHQKFTNRSIFYDDDYSGNFINHWSWRIALLSTDGYPIIAAADSVYSYDTCVISTFIDSIDLNKNWIFSETGNIFGLINIYATTSDGFRHNVEFTFQYSSQTTGIHNSEIVPITFLLHQNYPNPFNPTTTIEYQIPYSSNYKDGERGKEFVSLKVYDLLGREVASLVNEQKPAGRYTQHWNASNLPSGMYVYRLQTESFSESKKLVLLK